MRFSLLRLTLAAIMITSLVGCTATRERFAKAWPWGKKKYDTEQALANAAPYPTMPSETATPGTPGSGYGTPYANATAGTDLAGSTAPTNRVATTAGIYPTAGGGGYMNPAAGTTPTNYGSTPDYSGTQGYAGTQSYGGTQNYSGTYGTSSGPAYGAAPAANPYAQQSYAPAQGGTTSYAPPAQTTPQSYGAPQGYGVSQTAPSMNANQMPPSQYGAGSYSYGATAGTSGATASTASVPNTGPYNPTGYQATAGVGPTDYAPADNGYQPGNNGFQPAGVPPYQSPASPYTTGATGAEPYRPGGTGDYVPQSSAIPAGGSMSTGGVTPATYDTTN